MSPPGKDRPIGPGGPNGPGGSGGLAGAIESEKAGAASMIRWLLLAGRQEHARVLAARLIGGAFGMPVASVTFTMDEYSLNSVSGRITLADGTEQFFKFHTEDGETGHVTEYYRGELLATAGLPVEQPLAVSTVPGRQVALYELRTEPRLGDVCLDLEVSQGEMARLPAGLLAARRDLDRLAGEIAVATLGLPEPTSAGAAIHQLFYHRLAEPGGIFPGGRYLAWYLGQPGWADLAARRWRINGVAYASTLGEIVASAADLLMPERLAELPVVTAHGDDHQGNIWVLGGGQEDAFQDARLVLFDPAFAGTDIPALLAPVKATFHNALAHPFWLYHPAEAADRFKVRVRLTENEIAVDDDAWLAPLRIEILRSSAELIWRPLLGALRDRGELPANWRAVVRAALACCPLLVTNLIATPRPKPARFLALSRVVMAGSEPADGDDIVSQFLDQITP